jgi:hypothetical protein
MLVSHPFDQWIEQLETAVDGFTEIVDGAVADAFGEQLGDLQESVAQTPGWDSELGSSLQVMYVQGRPGIGVPAGELSARATALEMGEEGRPARPAIRTFLMGRSHEIADEVGHGIMAGVLGG